jgi:hypothetical protein
MTRVLPVGGVLFSGVVTPIDVTGADHFVRAAVAVATVLLPVGELVVDAATGVEALLADGAALELFEFDEPQAVRAMATPIAAMTAGHRRRADLARLRPSGCGLFCIGPLLWW